VRFLETPEFMINRKPQIESIKLLGYAEAEAQFSTLWRRIRDISSHASSPDSLVLTGAATTDFWKRLEAYRTGGCADVRRTLSVLSAEGDEEGGGNGTLLQNAGLSLFWGLHGTASFASVRHQMSDGTTVL
jgi:hypothetical protein